MKNTTFLLLVLCFYSNLSAEQKSIKSPDGKIRITFEVIPGSRPTYSVDYKDEPILLASEMGFGFKDGVESGKNPRIAKAFKSKVNHTWKPVYGEKSEIKNNYNQLNVTIDDDSAPKISYEITFRAYNQGIAFQYTLNPVKARESLTITRELTEFRLPADYSCWVSDRAQSEYRKILISQILQPAERPLLIETSKNFIALSEAKLVDFSRMKLVKGEKEYTLMASLSGDATVSLPYTTPWRTVMIGKSAGELLENNFFILNLNDPCALQDVSWIKPGKVIREVTLTTEGGLACVDFAASNGLQYVEFDAGWYGPENSDKSDATAVNVDPARSTGPLDLQKVIRYGKTKGIGIILYVNRRALEKQYETLFPLYKSWGIKGVKFGFVQVGSQEWTTWLHKAVINAAENQLLVDIHDEYRPTGFSRTYPNLLTQEGIRGDEESPTNEHTLITLFTRMLAGAADNTNCYFAPRVTEKMGGHVSQLAKSIMIYSPWQFLYWYDRPQGSPGKKGGAGDSDGFIKDVPEIRFYAELPTVWDETKVLESKVGEFALIARRSGKNWYLASLTGKNSKNLQANLSFLEKGKAYHAEIYGSDKNLKTPTQIEIKSEIFDSESKINFKIESNSGLVIILKPNH